MDTVGSSSRIKEILEEMKRDQELAGALRAEILGQEFSRLPAAVAQNQDLIVRLIERQIELSGATRAAMQAMVSGIERLGGMMAEAVEMQGQRMEGVEIALSVWRKEDQEIQTALGNTQAGLAQLQEAVQQNQGDVKQLQVDVRRVDGRLDRGFGTNYESKVAWNIRSILGQHAGIRNSKMLKGPNLRTDEDFEKVVDDAETSGAITEGESDELWLLDLIASGTRRGISERVYIAAEVSITADAEDVNRAADRAETLRRITKGSVTPVVIATRIDEPYRKLAVQRGAIVAIHPE